MNSDVWYFFQTKHVPTAPQHVTSTSDVHPSVSATLQGGCHGSSPIHINLLKDRGLSKVDEWNVKVYSERTELGFILSNQRHVIHVYPLSCFLPVTYLCMCYSSHYSCVSVEWRCFAGNCVIICIVSKIQTCLQCSEFGQTIETATSTQKPSLQSFSVSISL